MSLKPIKKGDPNKRWMKERPDRNKEIRPEYHLIVTEGTKTEPLYFQAIRDKINQKYRNSIQLDIYGEGDNTLSLFEKAKKRADGNPNVYKHVWIVYDTDDFPSEHINSTAELCKQNSTKETQYHALWSNQCIELWFLLHFDYFQTDIDRSDYWPKLSVYLKKHRKGAYSKGRRDMYEILSPYMDQAIHNAKNLDASHGEKTPADSKPGTKIYELIEILKPYL